MARRSATITSFNSGPHDDREDAQHQGERFSVAEEETEILGPVPRDDREARQLLQLARLEGHDPLQQALVGQLATSRLDHIAEGNDSQKAEWARDLNNELKKRFNEISPTVYKPLGD